MSGHILAQTLYLFSPLLFAVALSAVVHRYDLVRTLKRPIDGGLLFRGKRLFGDSKTWRGVAVAVVGCVAMVTLQRHVLGRVPSLRAIGLVDYDHVHPIVFGGAMGLAAMAGELPNSFVKRQLGIAPGKSASSPIRRAVFWTWDQVDLVIFCWFALPCWIQPTLALVVTSFAMALVLHPAIALAGYLLGARTSAR